MIYTEWLSMRVTHVVRSVRCCGKKRDLAFDARGPDLALDLRKDVPKVDIIDRCNLVLSNINMDMRHPGRYVKRNTLCKEKVRK